jgi:hypothetical protein
VSSRQKFIKKRRLKQIEQGGTSASLTANGRDSGFQWSNIAEIAAKETANKAR